MGLNVAGVSGFLSAAYERSHVAAQATAHVAEQTARASASVTERMLATAEQKLAAANQALIRARDDRGRVKAAQAVIATATAERDALVKQLGAARSTEAKAEGAAIEAGGEFAAVAFIASATGADQGTVAHAIILLIATLPDTLAVLLILAAGRTLVPAPTRKPVRRKAVRRRKSAILKVVPNEQAA